MKNLKMKLLLSGSFLFTACSQQHLETPYNKSFDYWEKEITTNLEENDLEKLKTNFIIFSNEHRKSSFLPGISRKIINKLIKEKKWEEALFFINNHLEKFISKKDEDLTSFNLIEARYHLLDLPNRLQNKYIELLQAITLFKTTYPYSIYLESIKSIEHKLKIKKAFFDKDISDLYKRIGKRKASNYYKKLYLDSGIDLDKNKKPKSPIYRRIFEGDGSSSWIGIFIPEGKNVVSEKNND